MNQIEQPILGNQKGAVSFRKEWKALPRPIRKGIDRGIREKKAEYYASETVAGLGVVGAGALSYVVTRYTHFNEDLGRFASEPLALFPPALPGLLIAILSGTHAADVKDKINEYRKTAIHVIGNIQPDWLVNPPQEAKKKVASLLQTPVEFPTKVKNTIFEVK